MIEILLIIFLVYFYYVSGYNFVLALAGILYQPTSFKPTDKRNRFVVLIPAYKEDLVILDVAKKALEQHYPKDLFDVVVIADSLQPETIAKLKELPIILESIDLEESTKVKALNIAMSKISQLYDNAIIIDADNVMDEDFILKMNNLHQQGLIAIQGRRAAKNENNSLSLLDGLSEEINNHVLGKGTTFLKLSASLKGSGMSFEYQSIKKHLSEMESVGGFDRELELRYQSEGIKVVYASDIIVYDEKISKDTAFVNQRKRWIASQFHYLFKYFWSGMVQLFRGNISYFNSAILKNVQLPRLLNLGLSLILVSLVNLLEYYGGYVLHSIHWDFAFIVLFVSLLLSIPRSYYTWKLLRAIFLLPKIFLKMLGLLFKLRGANKRFIHTPHESENTSSNE